MGVCVSLPPSRQQWLDLLNAGVGYPTFEPGPAGHVIIAARSGRICTCGWAAPDRSGDPHAAALALDDVDWHAHLLDAPCASHQPPYQVCSTCEHRPRRVIP